MSFIRAKEIPPHSGNWYDYLVETYHENGHVRQRVLQYLGKPPGYCSWRVHIKPVFDKDYGNHKGGDEAILKE